MNTTLATNKTESVKLVDCEAIGIHRDGHTAVKLATDGRYAVVDSRPRRDGSLRLIKVFGEELHARRYNFSIHGDRLGE